MDTNCNKNEVISDGITIDEIDTLIQELKDDLEAASRAHADALWVTYCFPHIQEEANRIRNNMRKALYEK